MKGSLLCSSLPENMPGRREAFYFVVKLPVREKWNRSPGKSSLELVEACGGLKVKTVSCGRGDPGGTGTRSHWILGAYALTPDSWAI